jgi:hypothetical protein
MTKRSNATYVGRIRQDAREFGRLSCITFYAWLRLGRQFALCLWMTLRLVGRTLYWVARLAWPVPTAVDDYGRRRRNWNKTGLPIPTGDMLTLVAGAVLVAGYYL